MIDVVWNELFDSNILPDMYTLKDDCLHCFKYSIYKINWWKNIVIGDGLMAKAFLWMNLDKKVIVFASGVSNSNEHDFSAFDQEKKLLLRIQNEFPDYTLVYFSSCSVFDSWLQNAPYVHHKKTMEDLIKNTSSSYCVLRLPIVVWKSTNPNTLVNNLYNNIISEKPFEVRKDAKRYLIDVDDVRVVVSNILADEWYTNKIVDVALFQYSILDIVHVLEKITWKKPIYSLVDKWWSYNIDTSVMQYVSDDVQSNSSIDYLESILRKYYDKHI